MRLNEMKTGTGTQIAGLLALDIYCAYTILSGTAWTDILGRNVFGLMWKAMLGCLVLRVILDDQHTIRQLFVWGFLFPLLIPVVRNAGSNRLFLQMSLVLLLYGIPFRRIVRSVFTSCLFWTLFVWLSCRAGILTNYEFNHGSKLKPVIAQGMGFDYYSTFAFLILTMTAAWLYLRKEKCTAAELAALAVFHWLSYRHIHTTRLVVLTSEMYLVLFVIVVKLKWLTFRAPVWKKLAMLLPFLTFGGTWLLVWLYDHYRHLFDLMDKLFPTLSSRLSQSVEAYHMYGIRLFGSRLYLQGNRYVDYNTMKSGLYLDSNYVYMLLAYGVVVSLIVIVLISLAYGYIYELQDPCLFLWFGTIIGISMVNNFLLNAIYNVALLTVSQMLAEPGKKRRINEQKYSDQQNRAVCGRGGRPSGRLFPE